MSLCLTGDHMKKCQFIKATCFFINWTVGNHMKGHINKDLNWSIVKKAISWEKELQYWYVIVSVQLWSDLMMFSYLFHLFSSQQMARLNHLCLHYHHLCLSQRTAWCFGPNLAILGKLKTLPDQYISFYEGLSTRIICRKHLLWAWPFSILRVVSIVLPVTFWWLSMW